MTSVLPLFPLGVQYYRQPTPLPEEWPVDLQRIKDMGFDTIQLRPHWRWHERNEGRLIWDDTDALFDLAAKNKLTVIFKFMLECAPDWLFRKYEASRVTPRGEVIEPTSHGAFYPGGWLPCFDRSDVRTEANRFLREGVKRYRAHPSLAAWHLWNEPRSRPNGDCACSESVLLFRAWLKDRFKTVQKLNDFGGMAYSGEGSDFSFIDPPVATSDYFGNLLWRRFRADMVADRLRWVREEILKEDRSRPLICHAGFCSALQDPLEDVSDDFLNSRNSDVYGSSCPNRSEDLPLLSKQSWQYAACIPDLICARLRGLGKQYWMHEIYGNGGQSRPPLTPAYLQQTLWASTAGGAKGLVIWQYRSERVSNESNESGLVEIDGSPTPRSKAVEDVLQVISKHRKEFAAAELPRASVAVVYDFASDLISRIEVSPAAWVREGSVGCRDDYPYKASLRGIHMALWEADIAVDMIPSERLEEIKGYAAIYLACPRVIKEQDAELLRQYVQSGGILICEPSPGIRTPNGWQRADITAPYLESLFGARESGREFISSNWPLTMLGRKLNCMPDVLCTTIAPLDASERSVEVLGRWKKSGIAATVRKVEKGAAVLLGFPLGEVYFRGHDENVRATILSLLARFKIHSTVAPALNEHVRVRVQNLPDGDRLFFIFNYSNGSRRVVLQSVKGRRFEEVTKVGIRPIRAGAGKPAMKVPANAIVVLRERR